MPKGVLRKVGPCHAPHGRAITVPFQIANLFETEPFKKLENLVVACTDLIHAVAIIAHD